MRRALASSLASQPMRPGPRQLLRGQGAGPALARGACDWLPPASAEAALLPRAKLGPRPLPSLCLLLSAQPVPSAGPGSGRALPTGATEERGCRRQWLAQSSPGWAMKVEFAPLNIPLARRLQTVAVLQWVLYFVLLGKDPAPGQRRVGSVSSLGMVRIPEPA